MNLNILQPKLDYSKVFIDRLYFEVTNICNAACVFCAYPKIKQPQGIMKFEVFKKAIEEYASLGGEKVSFTPTVGDPLIDNGLLDKIAYAKNLGFKRIYFYSNGLLLRKNFEKLVDSGLTDIQISTAGCDKDQFEAVYKIKGYEMVMEGLQRLLEYNKASGEKIKIGINFRGMVSPEKIMEAPDFKNIIQPFLSDRVKVEFLTEFDNWGGMITEQDLVGSMKLKPIPKKKLPCIRTFDASILWNGDIRLCACRIKTTEFDGLVVGNIMETSLKEAYYGTKAKQVRESFGKELIDVCKECSFYGSISKNWIIKRS